MIKLTEDNFQKYIEPIRYDLPLVIEGVYSGLIYFVNEFDVKIEENETAKESLAILQDYVNENYKIEAFPEPDEQISESNNTLVNQELRQDENQQENAELHENLSEETKEVVKKYHIVGDYRIEEKVNMINILHAWFGFPLTKKKIKDCYGDEISEGINKLAKALIAESQTSYSESTVKALINTVIAIDNSN